MSVTKITSQCSGSVCSQYSITGAQEQDLESQ